MCLEASWVHPSLIINDLPHLEKKPLLSSLSAWLPFPQPKTNITSGVLLGTQEASTQGKQFFLYAWDWKKRPWLVFKINGYRKTCKQRLTIFDNFLGKTPFLQILHRWHSESCSSLVVQWLRLCTSSEGGSGSIPGWGTRILHAKKKKEINTYTSLKPKMNQILLVAPVVRKFSLLKHN